MIRLGRRQVLVAGVAGVAASVVGPEARARRVIVAAAPVGFELDAPERVFTRRGDQDRLRLDPWLFTLVLRGRVPRKPALATLVVTQFAGGSPVRTTTHAGTALAAMDLVPAVPASPERSVYPLAAFQLADAPPRALGIDRIHVELAWRDDAGKPLSAGYDVRISAYVQKTALVFPFRGRGLITQGGAWNDGHRNRSGMFAIDAIGLDAHYAPMRADGDSPAAMVGWEREIIAPAAGVVVAARGDRPDQPVTGVSDPHYFVAGFPQGGDPGNHVVIDHGGGELSLIAHLRHDSLAVKVGDTVAQGQRLGLLGNSGDTDSPHVHHQLQSGPDWTTADALPHVYTNDPQARHDRGAFFDAT